MTKANEIKFGIEVETHISSSDYETRVGTHYNPRQVSWLPSGWKVGKDISINHPSGRQDAEFVSPILVGEAGVKEAYDAVKAINDRGARVNASCGVHVTVTFPSDDAAALARLICLFAHFETGFFATTGSTRRENGCWCKGVKKYGENVKTGKAKVKAVEKEAKQTYHHARYHAINLTHLAHGHSRVEFRLFSGSTNADKIIAWVRFILAVVEFAINSKRSLPFDNNSKDQRWGGEGQRDLNILLCKLGWLKWKPWGYKGVTYGDVSPEGVPSIEDSTKVLRRLAKKYDAERAAS